MKITSIAVAFLYLTHP